MSRDACRLPAPSPQREKLYTVAVLASLSGAVAGIGQWWLHPHGVGTVFLILASVLIAMATGMASFVIPVAREECRVTVTAPCGCAFICLQPPTQAHRHAGPFTLRCAEHAS